MDVNRNESKLGRKRTKSTSNSRVQCDKLKIKKKVSAIEKKYKNIAPANKQKKMRQKVEKSETHILQVKKETEEYSKESSQTNNELVNVNGAHIKHDLEVRNTEGFVVSRTDSNTFPVASKHSNHIVTNKTENASCFTYVPIKQESNFKDDTSSTKEIVSITNSPNLSELPEGKSKDVSKETLNKLRSKIINKSNTEKPPHSAAVQSPVLRTHTPPQLLQEVPLMGSREQSPVNTPHPSMKQKIDYSADQNESRQKQIKTGGLVIQSSGRVSEQSAKRQQDNLHSPAYTTSPVLTPPKKRCIENWRAGNQFTFPAHITSGSSASPIINTSLPETVIPTSIHQGTSSLSAKPTDHTIYEPSPKYPLYPSVAGDAVCSHCNRFRMDGVAEDKGFLFAAQINLSNGAILLIPCKHVIIQGVSYLKPQQDLFHSVYQFHINPPTLQNIDDSDDHSSGRGNSQANQSRGSSFVAAMSPQRHNLLSEQENDQDNAEEPINLSIRPSQAECDSTDRDTPPLVIDDCDLSNKSTNQSQSDALQLQSSPSISGVCVVCHYPFNSPVERQSHYQSHSHLESLVKTGLLQTQMYQLIKSKDIPLNEIIDSSTGNVIPRTLIRYQPFLNS